MNATTSAQRARQWTGPALFSYGFRPFFLAGALYAAIAVGVWVPWYLGAVTLPTDWPPIAWHAHELLFGYVPAVVAGFLLTAVPNWTGRLPVVGWPLAGLFAFWLLGRFAIATSDWFGAALTAIATLSFLAGLGAVIGREILAGRNWKNLKVLIIVVMLFAAQALFQWEVLNDGHSVYGARLAIATTITLIVLIGGRIVPSFTGNWLRQRGGQTMPVPFSRFDAIVIAVSVVALAAWIVAPSFEGVAIAAAPLLLLAGILQLVRQARWRPLRTFAEPLVTILHVAYLFVPLGFLLAAVAAASESAVPNTAAIHAWTAGAIGTMTLAVMTRATLGHTGRTLTAGAATVAIYGLVVLAALTRIGAAVFPSGMDWLLSVSAVAWIGAFAGFSLVYGPLLVRRRGA
ncbi:NnrS family protein [Microbaculum marinisediminis]|uniref:NnrS family protein n=1 Tax=Microbaculum marinisediminis TaxID=2931392 RepID=A0AAW5R416_9HYPH|nr:NnrS family protein [Microbaculum sp. A6E488]MCT8973613.1 NnrS family protein [Microbaculum sp. A6E488]